MTQSLSRLQATFLGLLVLSVFSVGLWGVMQIGNRQGLFNETFELVVTLPDAQDVEPGTSVRIRGVEAGKVLGVDYPETDGPDSAVRLRLQIQKRFQERIFADARAQVLSKGLLGTSVVAIAPGTPAAGILETGFIKADKPVDITEVMTRLTKVAEKAETALAEAETTIRTVRESKGSLNKIIHDETLYNDLQSLTKDTRLTIKRVDTTIESMQGDFRDLIRSGKEAVVAIKQDAEALKSMPLIRGYVEDAPAKLIRPTHRFERDVFPEADLFEAGTASLTPEGREKLDATAGWINSNKDKGSEIVVVSSADPRSKDITSDAARTLTKKQSEVVAEYLRTRKVHNIGFWKSSRDISALGLGIDPSPVTEKEKLPPAHTQVILFIPK